ncbi:MAG: glycerol kinase [Flexilinea sp.]
MKKYIVTIDQSTSASKVFLLDEKGAIVRRFSKEHQQFYPAPGYVEHDAEEFYQNVVEGIAIVLKEIDLSEVGAIAISNQRETTVIWDRKTGKPVCHAVVWQDVRGDGLVQKMSDLREQVLQKTGLALSAYFPAAKAAAVFRESRELLERAKNGELCLGTVDSYLIYRFSGCTLHATDVSNASRTQLFNLSTLGWDNDLLTAFNIPAGIMATKILHSDAIFTTTACKGIPDGIPVTGVMGDSHAALFGNGCHTSGTAKATYGTGSSVMLNVGTKPIFSTNGLSASVGFGFKGEICYVLEGNITCSGDTLVWLRDELKLIDDVKEVEAIASTVSDTQGVCLVPAFSGLGAPYFDGSARAMICGMNRGTTKKHILRAALESIAHQDADCLDAMKKDFGKPITQIFADGGPTTNGLLMQMQADFVPCLVNCSAASELSALGAGYMAGITTGVYKSFDEIEQRKQKGKTYKPCLSELERKKLRANWQNAILRARLQDLTISLRS